MQTNPYAPPASSLDGAPETLQDNETAGFRDLSGITGKVSLLLLIGLGLRILGTISSWMYLNLLSHVPFTVADAHATDMRERLSAITQLIAFLITAVVFGRWIYLAHRNLPSLGARHERFTPGWSVGYFFIPILNFWRPYQAMNFLAQASRTPRELEFADSPPQIFIWWVLWLVSQFLNNWTARGELHAERLEDLHAITIAKIASGLISIPLYLLALNIVRRVWRDQSASHTQIVNADRSPTS